MFLVIRRIGLLAVLLVAFAPCASVADDILKLAIGQGGGWEQSVPDLGVKFGFFGKRGIKLDVLYTQGSGETLQSVISGSVDLGHGLSAHSVLGAYAKGAPVRIIGTSLTGADDQIYYVIADSPVTSMKDAGGRTIATSTTGSASHMYALGLARFFGVRLVPQPTGNYASTLTQVMTRQVDIGFAAIPFALDAVEVGRIRIIAYGRDIPEFRDQSSRTITANAAALARKRDVFARFILAYQDTVDWFYSGPDAVKAYVDYSGFAERFARRAAEEFHPRAKVEPSRVTGLDAIMADAVRFKYLPAPLTPAQLGEAIQLLVPPRG
jgi:NitT/TauT family transport system substrate-binding protein